MICPVCKSESSINQKCTLCGFENKESTFSNRSEESLWERKVVVPYRLVFLSDPQNLAEAKKRMQILHTDESIDTLYDFLEEIIENDTWISAPMNDHHFISVPFRGGQYLPMYSGMAGRDPSDSKEIINLSISKLIDILYDNPHLLGIIIDPQKDPFPVDRKIINKISKKKDPRQHRRYWGCGIPDYTPKDLMTGEELLRFGMDIIVERYLTKQGYIISETNYGTQGFPNFVLNKDGELFLLKVSVSISQHIGLSKEEEEFCLSTCEEFKAKCLFASIVLIPMDEERDAKRIALYGDEYDATLYVTQILPLCDV